MPNFRSIDGWIRRVSLTDFIEWDETFVQTNLPLDNERNSGESVGREREHGTRMSVQRERERESER